MDARMLQRLMADARKKQKEFDEKTNQLNEKTFTHVHGNNHVVITANGKSEILSIDISESLLEEKDMLQDLIIESINEILSKIKEEHKKIQEQSVPKSVF